MFYWHSFIAYSFLANKGKHTILFIVWPPARSSFYFLIAGKYVVYLPWIYAHCLNDNSCLIKWTHLEWRLSFWFTHRVATTLVIPCSKLCFKWTNFPQLKQQIFWDQRPIVDCTQYIYIWPYFFQLNHYTFKHQRSLSIGWPNILLWYILEPISVVCLSIPL